MNTSPIRIKPDHLTKLFFILLVLIPVVYVMYRHAYYSKYKKGPQRVTIDPKYKVDDPNIEMYVIDNFLTKEQCDGLIRVIHTNLEQSTTLGDYDERVTNDFRTSRTYNDTLNNEVMKHLDKKISDTIGIPLCYSEPVQGQVYDVGQQFKPHYDYFYETHKFYDNQRTWTFMIYLNEVEEGGHTRFIKLGKSFKPKIGKAVIWNNLYKDGTPNPNTEHAGEPVIKGNKAIITKWFHEKEYVHPYA